MSSSKRAKKYKQRKRAKRKRSSSSNQHKTAEKTSPLLPERKFTVWLLSETTKDTKLRSAEIMADTPSSVPQREFVCTRLPSCKSEDNLSSLLTAPNDVTPSPLDQTPITVQLVFPSPQMKPPSQFEVRVLPSKPEDNGTPGKQVPTSRKPSRDPTLMQVPPLRNFGNTCYFNSVVQCMLQTYEIVNEISRVTHKEVMEYRITRSGGDLRVILVFNPPRSEMSEALLQVYDLTSSSSDSELDHNQKLHDLLSALGKADGRFARRTQEDSHEAYRAIIGAIKKEEIEGFKQAIENEFGTNKREYLETVSKRQVAISKVFQGSVVSSTICHECFSVVETSAPYFDIPLPMPGKQYEESAKEVKRVATPTSNQAATGSKRKNSNEGGSRRKRAAAKGRAFLNRIVKNPIWKNGSKNSAETDDMHESTDQHAKMKESQSTSAENHTTNTDKVYKKEAFQAYLQQKGYNHFAKSVNHCSGTGGLKESLFLYTDLDVLDEDNKIICETCTEKMKADDPHATEDTYVECCVSKQMMFVSLPPVLVLYMKRFEFGFYNMTKNNQHVPFPELLDMAPYCTSECFEELADRNDKILYSLYGVVVHIGGTLKSGHYIAYVKKRNKKPPNPTGCDRMGRVYQEDFYKSEDWYYTSDSSVHRCEKREVFQSKAYMLFYERLPLSL